MHGLYCQAQSRSHLKSAAIELNQMSSELTEKNAQKTIGVSEPSERQTYRAYVMWILAIQAGLSAMYFAIDNAFLAEVKSHFTTAEAVGTFLGYTSAAAALLSIVLGPLSGRLLVPRFGTVTLVRLTPLFVLSSSARWRCSLHGALRAHSGSWQHSPRSVSASEH